MGIFAESVQGYSTIPYVSGTSEPIKRVLENHGIKVTFKPYQTISKMFPKLNKTKWIKKILVIPFTKFHELIAARVSLAKRRENP